MDGWWRAKGHLVLDGSAVCHPEHYFFIACILPQKKRDPIVDCCMESLYLMNAHSLIHHFVNCCIET